MINDKSSAIVYSLPLTETEYFPGFFQALEYSSAELGIQSMGVSAGTMEDVFLK